MARESCEPTLNQKGLVNGIPKRNNYFSGKAVTAKNLTQEQSYFIDKIKQMNSELSGYGIVNGFGIDTFNSSKQIIYLNPGIGVDSVGNLLALYQGREFKLPRSLEEGDYIYLRLLEKGAERVARNNDEECGSECCFNYIVEEFEIVLEKENFNLDVNEVCREEGKKIKINHKQKLLKERAPFLLLGRYRRGKDKTGNLNISERVYLHTNTELSKLLCKIEHHHVRSLNKQFGDVFAVSSISGVEPNGDGKLELLAGNNISISSEENKITVATKGGFYQTYEVNFKDSNRHEITHSQGRYPVVDVYKAIEIKGSVIAYDHKELIYKARDLNIPLEIYVNSIGAKPLTEYIDTYKVAVVTRGPKVKKSQSYMNSKKISKNVFDSYEIKNFSPAVTKRLAKEIKYNIPNIMIAKHYKYVKVIGKEENLNIEVTHLDSNRVEFINRGENKPPVKLMVILTT